MTTMTLRQSKPNLLLPFLALAALGGLMICVTNAHAIERHGDEAAQVAASFDDFGKCDKGPSVVMRAESGVKMFICFIDQAKIDLHIQNSEGGTITDIPSSQISKPVKYLTSVFKRMVYQMERSYGDWPQWFEQLLEGL